jgi:hypothetical protein
MRIAIAVGLIACLSAGPARAASSDSGNAPPDSSAAPRPDSTAALRGNPPRHGVPIDDKLQHATLSLSIGAGLGIVSRSVPLALGGTLALGTLKELRDRRHTRFDPWDLAADLAGAALAAVITRNLIR